MKTKYSLCLVFLCAIISGGTGFCGQTPAIYSNLMFMPGQSRPLYVPGGAGLVLPGGLLDLPAPGSFSSPGVSADITPLQVFSGVQEAERNSRTADGIRKAIDDARGASNLRLPVLGTAAGPGVATGALLIEPQTGGGGQGTETGKDSQGNEGEENGGKKFKVDISGFRYLKYRQYSSSGNSNSFLSRTGLITYGDKIEQGSMLEFKAAYGDFAVSGNINEMPLQERDMAFSLDSGLYTASLGDFTSKFQGGEFATLNKRITGAELGYKTKKLEMMMVSSQSKSETRNISFNGNNTHGPYDLDTFEMLPGSAQVLVNGQPLATDEYDIDYYSGRITFCSNRIPPDCTNIKTSDTVQVIFEQKLLFSLKGGGIRGLMAGYDFGDGKGKIGYAYLSQEANRSDQSVRRAKTETFTGQQLLEQGFTFLDQKTIQLSDVGTKYPGLIFMQKGTETVKKNGSSLQRGADYTVAYDGYGRGRLQLVDLPSASDTFEVSFSYYVDEYVNVSLDEDIIDTGEGTNIYYLSRYTVYSGLESVFYCKGDNCEIKELLQPGADKDYTIDENDNSIIVHSSKRPNALEGAFLRLNYYYVPSDSPTASNYDHTVSNIFGQWEFGDVLGLSFDYADSLSDVGRTPVQIMNEVLLTATTTFTCHTAGEPAPECVRTLANQNIVEDSEMIKFNTRSTALVRGSDYTVEALTGHVTFRNSLIVPAGTVVYASYRYTPAIDMGLVGGKAVKLSGRTGFKGISLSFNRTTMDTTFAPLGGNNTLETERLDYTLNAPIGKGINVEFGRSKFVRAEDIFEFFSTTTNERRTSVSYNGEKKLKRIAWSFTKAEDGDNRNPRYNDTSRKANSLEIELDEPFLKKSQFSYMTSSEDFSDLTGRIDDTSSKKNEIAFAYKPKPELAVNVTTGVETVSSGGVSDPYSTRTMARNIIAMYQPTPMFTLSANIDSQRISDSRPEALASGVDTSAIRLTSMPFWRVRSLSLSVTQEDRPSQFTGGTRNDVRNLTFTIASSKSMALTPTLTFTKGSSPGSTTTTSFKSMKAEYLPPGKKYETVGTWETSDTSSTSTGVGPSGTTMRRLGWDFKYKLSETANMVYRFSRTDNSGEEGKSSGDKRNGLSYIRAVGEKLRLTAQYTIYDTYSDSTNTENKFELISAYKVNKLLIWNLDYSMTKFASGDAPESDFSGTLLETELKLQF